MAFLRKAGSILRQTTTGRQINSEINGANPSIFQIIRCMSSSKIFVGGLSFSTDEQGLGEAFSHYGQVVEARVIVDRESSRSRGFGFVTFTTPEEASAAIQAMDQAELHGRRVRVNYATEKPRGGGFGYSGGGGYGGSGGGYGGGGGGYGGGGGGYGGGSGGYGGGYGGGDGNYNQGGGGNYNNNFGNNYSQGSNLDSGSGGDFGAGNQSFGIAGGVGGTDTFASGNGGAAASFENTGGFDGEIGNNGALGLDDSVGDNLRDDDNEFAKRA